MSTRVRFAPSPTGSLHLGNARTALFNWLVARKTGGTFILRIEDTDTEREQVGSEAGIFEDLRWLGLDWDEGPDCSGPFPPYRQSERSSTYREAAERLLDAGLAYPCFCSDETLEAERAARRVAGLPPRYSGRCRDLPAEDARRRASSEAHAVRFQVEPASTRPEDRFVSFVDRLRGRVEFPLAELGDLVLVRRDGRPTYNFAVVVDDAAMDVTLVLRGDDHLSNTPRQVLLFRALGHQIPEFAHLPMVLGPDGERLSKRHGAASVAEMRRAGYPAEAVVNAVALIGWAPTGEQVIFSLDELRDAFDLARVSRAPGIFDPAKLNWIASQHVHSMSDERVAAEAGAFLVAAGLLPSGVAEQDPQWMLGLARMLKGGIEHFDQVPVRSAGLFVPGGWPADAAAQEALLRPGAKSVIESLERHARELAPVDVATWKQVVAAVKTASAASGKGLFLPIRAAITGSVAGPELDLLVPLATRGSALLPDRIESIGARAARTLSEWP